MVFTRRNLPHISNPEEIYFITYRQAGTWKTKGENGDPTGCLTEPAVSKVILDSWQDLSREKVRLFAVCIMPDHVHAVFKTVGDIALSQVVSSHKKFTARRINGLLASSGAFWQEETYDHIVRSAGLEAAISYTILNPVKAGVVQDWRTWPFCYLDPEFESIF